MAVRQQAVLPSGSVLVSCPAPFGVGGLGRHLDEIVAALDRSGEQTVCVCGSIRDAEAENGGRFRFAYVAHVGDESDLRIDFRDVGELAELLTHVLVKGSGVFS